MFWTHVLFILILDSSVGVAGGYSKKLNNFVSIATASQFKFPETIKIGLDIDIDLPFHIKELFKKNTSFLHLKLGLDWNQILFDKIIEINK
jgi:threonine synthase